MKISVTRVRAEPGSMAHVFSPSTREEEVGRALWVRDQSGLLNSRIARATEKWCLEKAK